MLKKTKYIVVSMLVVGMLTACGKGKVDTVDFGTQTSTNTIEESTEKEVPIEEKQEDEQKESVVQEKTGEQEKEEQDDVIQAFLLGKAKAKIADDFENRLSYTGMVYNYGEEPSEDFTVPATFDVDELMECIKATDGVGPIKPVASYYIGKTENGTPILLYKVEGLNIYWEDDDSFAVFAFAQKDGVLELNFAEDSWARNYVSIYEDFSFGCYGSSGAGDSSADRVHLDENGKYAFDYDMHCLFADWIGMNLLEDYESNFGFDEEDEVDILTTSEGMFYSISSLAGNEGKFEEVKEALSKKGAEQVEDVSALIEEKEVNELTDWTYIE